MLGLYSLSRLQRFTGLRFKLPKEKSAYDEAASYDKRVEKDHSRLLASIHCSDCAGCIKCINAGCKRKSWGITSAFALWGGKAMMAAGIDVSSWGFFQGANGEALTQSVLADSTSVLNFGIILGAFISATAQGTFKPGKIKPGVAGAAVVGAF